MLRRNKYNVSPAEARTFMARCYDSKAECLYAKRLYAMRSEGLIRDYVEQPSTWLGIPENKYRADFLVIPNTKRVPYYIDVKGVETPQFKKTKKLWAKYAYLDLVVVKLINGKKFEVSEVIPGGADPKCEDAQDKK